MDDKEKSKETAAISKRSDVMETYDRLTAELKALEHERDSPYKTGGIIKLRGSEYDIKTMNNLSSLIELAGQILNYTASYTAGAQALELEKYPKPTLGGLGLDDILQDIQKRAKVITFEKKVKAIEKFLRKIENDHFSKQDKFDRDMAALKEETGIDLTEV